MSAMQYLTEGIFRPDVLATVDGQPHLVGSRCSVCGDVRFPPAVGCPSCHAAAESLEAIPLSRRGTVVAATRVERAIPPFLPPYLLSYVQLPEGPRVLCQLVADDLEPARTIGRSCELAVAILYEKNGVPTSGYKFRVQP
jgi:uncharacterized OB-fold protein